MMGDRIPPETAAPPAPDWLREHGDDLIPVRLIDLLCAVARMELMEQVSRAGGTAGIDSIHERIFTCDLPRLRRYLPVRALEAARDIGLLVGDPGTGWGNFPVIPPGQIEAEVAADVHRMGWDKK